MEPNPQSLDLKEVKVQLMELRLAVQPGFAGGNASI